MPVGWLNPGQCQGQCSVFVLRKCQSYLDSKEVNIKLPDITLEDAEIQEDKVFMIFFFGGAEYIKKQ